jgi:hypothetical protein
MATERKVVEPAATVVSMVPFPIDEFKPGMSPSRFYIDPAPRDGFVCLKITKCTHGVYLDEHRPTLIVPTAPEEVAQSVCYDYKKGQLGIELSVAEPGLFWVYGDYAAKEHHKTLEAEFAAEFREARALQIMWFKRLIELADDMWSKFHRRATISEMQRIAASVLKLEREWLIDVEVAASLSECPVCFEKVHPRAIVCRGCQAILNEVEYAKRKFAMSAVAQTALLPPPVTK